MDVGQRLLRFSAARPLLLVLLVCVCGTAWVSRGTEVAQSSSALPPHERSPRRHVGSRQRSRQPSPAAASRTYAPAPTVALPRNMSSAIAAWRSAGWFAGPPRPIATDASVRRGASPTEWPDTMGCVTILRDVVFHAGDLQTATYPGPRVKLPVCSIDGPAPVTVRLTKAPGAPTLPHGGRPAPCDAFSVGVFIFRPQHAMQFLFGLVGAFAVLRHTGAVPAGARGSAVRFGVMRYGTVMSWADLSNTTRFPHLELLPLVLGRGARAFVLAEWASHMLRPPADVQVAEGDCSRTMAVGSLPQRIGRPDGVLPPTALTAAHYADFREYVLTRLRLPVPPLRLAGVDAPQLPESSQRNDDPGVPVVLVVRRRQTVGRRILNEDAVLDVVRGAVGNHARVRPVEWEGRSLRDQLETASGAVGMVGAHGNGLAWHCFMPPGSFLVELTSHVKRRNEVTPGLSRINAGNVGAACGLESLSVACQYEDTAASRDERRTPAHRRWKEVDLRPSQDELVEIRQFVSSWVRRHGGR